MDYRIGLDIGIASVGWAVLEDDTNGEPKRIVDLGVRIFDKAETPDGESLAADRRMARSARRRIRRRVHRLDRIKELLEKEGYIEKEKFMERYHQPGLPDVYELRYKALSQVLQPEELAQVLIHIAKHRGFHSTRKADLKELKKVQEEEQQRELLETEEEKEKKKKKEEDDDEKKRVLSATYKNQKLMKEKGYQTVGEMLYLDSRFRIPSNESARGYLLNTRNKKEDYKNTILRSMLIEEVNIIFEKQRELGNSIAKKELQEEYLKIMCGQRSFDQGPGNQSNGKPSPYAGNLIEKMIGVCTFEPKEPRAAKACYTSERFVMLQKLNNLRIYDKEGNVPELSDLQRMAIVNLVYQQKNGKVTYDLIRKELKLGTDYIFYGLTYNKENDIKKIESKTTFVEMKYFPKIREALGNYDLEKCSNKEFVEVLDEIGNILTKYKNDDTRIEKLQELPLEEEQIERLLEIDPVKFQHLSLKAMKKINIYLEQGFVYDKACEGAGYNHKAEREGERLHLLKGSEITEIIQSIPNPVVKRSVSQTFKVINAIILKYGSPQSVHVELAREVAKSFKEREKDEKWIKNNQSENERIKKQLEEWGVISPTGQDILKFRLWQEQGECCIYTGEHIPRERLFEKGVAEIDHIIPYSKSFDNSRTNKVLVKAQENQKKGNHIPFEYFGWNTERWNQYEQRVNERIKDYKKARRLLKKELTKEERKAFKERNLNDTSYMTTLVYNIINNYLEFAPYIGTSKIKKTFAVNGRITSYLRKRWGLEPKDRSTDTHHAVDAVVVACCTDRMIQKITRNIQGQEIRYAKGLAVEDLDPETKTEKKIYRDDYTEEQWIQMFGTKIEYPWNGFKTELEMRTSQNPQQYIEKYRKECNRLEYPEGEEEKIKPIFVSRMPNHKVTGTERADTIRSPRHFEEQNIVVSKVELSTLKLDKDGEIVNYYNPDSDKLLYEALKARLQEFGGDAKKAFEEKFYKPKSDGSQGPLVRKVKVWDKMTIGVKIYDNRKRLQDMNNNVEVKPIGIAANGNGAMIRVDVFKVEQKFYFVPIYISDTKKKELPNKAVVSGKAYKDWLEMKQENFLFSLYSNDLFYFKHKNFEKKEGGMSVKKSDNSKDKIKETLCYFKGANISTASFAGIAHDRSFSFSGLGIQTLSDLKKYQVDILGNYKEVKKEVRMKFL